MTFHPSFRLLSWLLQELFRCWQVLIVEVVALCSLSKNHWTRTVLQLLSDEWSEGVVRYEMGFGPFVEDMCPCWCSSRWGTCSCWCSLWLEAVERWFGAVGKYGGVVDGVGYTHDGRSGLEVGCWQSLEETWSNFRAKVVGNDPLLMTIMTCLIAFT